MNKKKTTLLTLFLGSITLWFLVQVVIGIPKIEQRAKESLTNDR